jgi:hypothetical protein
VGVSNLGYYCVEDSTLGYYDIGLSESSALDQRPRTRAGGGGFEEEKGGAHIHRFPKRLAWYLVVRSWSCGAKKSGGSAKERASP